MTRTDMTSPAIKLAKECGWFSSIVGSPPHTVNYIPVMDDQIETFYALAQAQALRDAATEALELGGFISQLNLIRMADELEQQK